MQGPKMCAAVCTYSLSWVLVAAGLGSTSEQAKVNLGRAIRQLKANWRLGVLMVPLLQLPSLTLGG